MPGAWLPGLYSYLTGAHGFSADQVAYVFAGSSLGAFLAPFYAGQLADRLLRADRLLALFYFAAAGLLVLLARAETFPVVLAACTGVGLVYAPTLSLSQTICLTHLGSRERLGPVRAWGTVGWVASGIAVSQWLLYRHTPLGVGEEVVRAAQDAGRADAFRLSAVLGVIMGAYCFTLPNTPPARNAGESNASIEAIKEVGRQPLLTKPEPNELTPYRIRDRRFDLMGRAQELAQLQIDAANQAEEKANQAEVQEETDRKWDEWPLGSSPQNPSEARGRL